MRQFASWLDQKTLSLLNHKTQAITAVVLFELLPFCAFLASALLALVSLRKGLKEGLQLLLVAVAARFVLAMALSSELAQWSVISFLMANIPCILAAGVLRASADWRLTAAGFFVLSLLAALWVHVLYPEFVMQQYTHLSQISPELGQLKEQFLAQMGAVGNREEVLAHFIFSGMILAAVIAALVPLLIARYLQSRCFNPGGFKRELMRFSCGKTAFFLFMLSLLASYNEILLAIDLMPLMILYFLISGLVLVQVGAQRMSNKIAFFFILVSLLVNPLLLFMLLLIIAVLDSLFDVRSYLPTKAV